MVTAPPRNSETYITAGQGGFFKKANIALNAKEDLPAIELLMKVTRQWGMEIRIVDDDDEL